jgi:hypothetical protein
MNFKTGQPVPRCAQAAPHARKGRIPERREAWAGGKKFYDPAWINTFCEIEFPKMETE